MYSYLKSEMNYCIDVSVIVPAYNAEKYISECLDSLLAQSLKTIEIVIVDDGSTDKTREIVLEYQKKNSCIKLLQQARQGAGAARNRGMDYAEGKYIVFLDADDFFEIDFLKTVYTVAEENNVQIVLYDYYQYNNLNGEKIEMRTPNHPIGVVSSKELAERLFQVGRMTPWNKFFLKSFLVENNLQFQNIKKSNDVFFSVCSLSMAQRILFLDRCFVYYRVENPDSLQGNVNDNTECGIISRLAAKQELEKRGLYEGEIKEAFYNCCKELKWYLIRITDPDVFCRYYHLLRKRLVPDLFDSYDKLKDEEMLNAVYKSQSYEDCLFRLYKMNEKKYEEQCQNRNSISKNCLDYRIGHFILRIPRKVKSGMRRVVNIAYESIDAQLR